MVAGPMAAATAFVRSDESEGGGLGHFGDDRVAEVAQLGRSYPAGRRQRSVIGRPGHHSRKPEGALCHSRN